MSYIRNIGIGLLLILILILVSVSSAKPANALINRPVAIIPSANNSGEALEIAPPLLYLTADPGQSIIAKIYLRDISSGPLIVTGTADDFISEGVNGTPKILLHETAPDPYSLKNYVAPIQSLLLQPKQVHILNLALNVPSTASPGGHYGVIRFTATPPSLNGGNGVALSASLGALVLLTVTGKIVENLVVNQFNAGQNGKSGDFFESAPLQITELLKNTGNEHVQPTGLLTLTDMFGHKLVVMDINRRQGNILPNSLRKFTQNINKNVIGSKRLFGRYTASVSIQYGSAKKTLNATMIFWVIPIKEIAILLIGLIGGFFLLRVLIRRYNRHILDNAKKKSK